MLSDVLITLIVFGTIFGIFYVYFTTRNKERMALIEKGIGDDIFSKKIYFIISVFFCQPVYC